MTISTSSNPTPSTQTSQLGSERSLEKPQGGAVAAFKESQQAQAQTADFITEALQQSGIGKNLDVHA